MLIVCRVMDPSEDVDPDYRVAYWQLNPDFAALLHWGAQLHPSSLMHMVNDKGKQALGLVDDPSKNMDAVWHGAVKGLRATFWIRLFAIVLHSRTSGPQDPPALREKLNVMGPLGIVDVQSEILCVLRSVSSTPGERSKLQFLHDTKNKHMQKVLMEFKKLPTIINQTIAFFQKNQDSTHNWAKYLQESLVAVPESMPGKMQGVELFGDKHDEDYDSQASESDESEASDADVDMADESLEDDKKKRKNKKTDKSKDTKEGESGKAKPKKKYVALLLFTLILLQFRSSFYKKPCLSVFFLGSCWLFVTNRYFVSNECSRVWKCLVVIIRFESCQLVDFYLAFGSSCRVFTVL